MIGQKDDAERARSLETLAVLAAACIVGGLVFRARAFAWAALSLLLIGFLFRRPAAMLAKVWLGFAAVLGGVNSKILLTVVYCLVLVPIAFIHRGIRGNPMNLERSDDADPSYWTIRDHRFEPRDIERPW
jgi:Saxitoxin biosynthesis operon protein SxtJ